MIMTVMMMIIYGIAGKNKQKQETGLFYFSFGGNLLVKWKVDEVSYDDS